MRRFLVSTAILLAAVAPVTACKVAQQRHDILPTTTAIPSAFDNGTVLSREFFKNNDGSTTYVVHVRSDAVKDLSITVSKTVWTKCTPAKSYPECSK